MFNQVGSLSPCKVQHPVYDAFLRAPEIAEQMWGDARLGGKLQAKENALRERFGWDFWMEDQAYYAITLDGAGSRVNSLASSV